ARRPAGARREAQSERRILPLWGPLPENAMRGAGRGKRVLRPHFFRDDSSKRAGLSASEARNGHKKHKKAQKRKAVARRWPPHPATGTPASPFLCLFVFFVAILGGPGHQAATLHVTAAFFPCPTGRPGPQWGLPGSPIGILCH